METARHLTTRLADLLRRERGAMADFLVALADFDRRRLWRDLGHASLFSFLRSELGLSAGAAQYRKTAAELVQHYPEVERALRAGDLCLSSIVELAKVVTPENIGEVLPQFHRLSSREAALVAVSIRPVENAPTREVVTAMRSVAPATSTASAGSSTGGVGATVPSAPRRDAELPLRAPEVPPGVPGPPPSPSDANATDATLSTPISPPRPGAPRVPVPSSAEPLDAERVRLHLTVSRRFLGKLEAVKDALSHAHPGATSDVVLEACLDAVLAQQAKRHGLVAKARPARPRTERRPVATAAAHEGCGDGSPPMAAPARAIPASAADRAALESPLMSLLARRADESAAGAGARGSVPAAVKREVWKRSGGRCEWTFASGEVCGSAMRLEYDHVTPRALGGPSTIENVRLLCRGHNDLAARKVFGSEWMDRYSRCSRPTIAPAPGR
jgi:hypothetical protein